MDARHSSPNSPSVRGLLPVVPDLVLIRSAGKSSAINRIAPWLAARLGKEPHELADQSAAALETFIPGLEALVDAALDGKGPVVSGQGLPVIATPVGHESGDGSRAVAVQVIEAADEAGLRAAHTYFGLIGHGPAMRDVFAKIERYATSPAPVLITGESGSGKELAARALHLRSPRRSAPFVAVNCAALSDELIESELFGHEKGAFTGALSAHRGRFERADGGTLLLDEIGDMARRSQTKLLRVLEEGAVERVGSERLRAVDVRVLAATNVPLERSVATRLFREDLYYRLSVLRLHLPALRERPEDVPLLTTYFLSVFAHRYGRRLLRLTPGALRLLTEYSWPGNVREIKNVLERVVVEAAGDVIGERAFSDWMRERDRLAPGTWDLAGAQRARASSAPFVTPYRESSPPALGAPTIDASYTESDGREAPVELTRNAALAALAASGGNVTRAAERLGLHKATLYRRLRAWGVTRKDFPTPS